MSGSYVVRALAVILATGFTLNSSHAKSGASVAATPANTPTSANQTMGTATTLPADTAYHVIDRGANHKLWQRESYEQLPNGRIVQHLHKYKELATGMHYQDAKGQWAESKEEIDPYPAGAIAQQGQYQVIFANNLNSKGAIDQQTPDGKRLRSNILGLSYYDSTTGKSVLIAQIQDSSGELISANQVLYPNAFTGVKADVRYTYKKGGFEQDVILREQPPTPESLGLNSQTTEIEVMTEFLNPPKETAIKHQGRKNGPADQDISWGAMRIGRGQAFDLGGQKNQAKPVLVQKQYATVNGRKILLEIVPIKNIQSDLKKLPLQSSLKTKLPAMASQNRLLPKTPLAKADNKAMGMAATTPSNQGYVLDYYEFFSDQTDFTFQADMTYLVSGVVNFSGLTTFEGGTVIKYDTESDSSSVQVWGTVACATSPYRPAIFTSCNDETVGESTYEAGAPTYYDSVLSINAAGNGGSVALHDIRISYTYWGLHPAYGDVFTLRDAQFNHCAYALQVEFMTCYFNNILINDVQEAFNCPDCAMTAAQVTVDGCSAILTDGWYDDPANSSLALTNCLLVNVADYGPVPLTTNYTVTLASGTGVFQVAGAGSHYLATSSPYHNAGTTNIDAATLADLATKTTYPPIVYSNLTISVATTLSPQAQRDNVGNPDLGYHYDPLDYAFGGVNVSTNLTFTAGTAVGWFELPGSGGPGYGVNLLNDVTATFNGTATSPCMSVRYDTVQEGGNGNWTDKGWLAGFTAGDGLSMVQAPTLKAGFTRFGHLAGDPGHFRDYNNFLKVPADNCEFEGSFGGYGLVLTFTNCLLDRVDYWQGAASADAAVIFRNCTFHGGTFDVVHWEGGAPYWYSSVRNCAFDGTAISVDDPFGTNSAYADYDYNAFLPGADQLAAEGVNNVTVTGSFNWQSSWLGDYYLPTDSPLIDAGSPTADLVGLYHFTTQTNQTVEGFSIVDIGYHYVATDAYGNPLDTDGDGIPDYIEDSNGNGIFDAGDLGDWLVSPFSGLSRTSGLKVFTPLK
jgi:hypothetical protein